MSFEFKHLALGGTFDLLHRGHREFLKYAFGHGAKVSIGVATDEMAKANEKAPVKNLSSRLEELENFLQQENFITRSKIILLKDIYGSAVSDKTIDGLVVTEETANGGKLVNQKRWELGLSELHILKAPLAMAEDNQPISSTRIRRGQINREGFSYWNYLKSVSKFILPEALRAELSKVHGELFKNFNILSKSLDTSVDFITVGDATAKVFAENKYHPSLVIVDFKVNRKVVYTKLEQLGFESNQKSITVKNDPGTINESLTSAIKDYFKSPSAPLVIKVDGEEDLAVLPVVLLAPLGTRVYYGQPGQGMVLIEVTEEKKAEFLKILKRFRAES